MGVITVLAGTNGAGKSSIGGALVRRAGGAYYNTDDETRAILVANPGLDLAQANGLAWTRGLENLRNAIAEGTDHAFETTLGGNTITRTLIDGTESAGVSLRVWYCAWPVRSFTWSAYAPASLPVAMTSRRTRFGHATTAVVATC